MRRYLSTGSLVVILAVGAGLGCYLWQAHDVPEGCGYAPGHGLPSFPVVTALIVLVAGPVLLAGASAVLERRSPKGVAAFMVLAAVLAVGAFAAAALAFYLARGCYK